MSGMTALRTRGTPVARRSLSVFLILHGFAHLVGAQGSWEAASTGSAFELLWGAWTVTSAPLLWILAIAWAATAVAYAHAAWLLWDLRTRWLQMLVIVTAASLVLSILALPMAVAGVVINAILLLGVIAYRTRQQRG